MLSVCLVERSWSHQMPTPCCSSLGWTDGQIAGTATAETAGNDGCYALYNAYLRPCNSVNAASNVQVATTRSTLPIIDDISRL
eukprot:scaffold141844_cov14-Tisochrysis_lutea.AAC.1